MVSSAFGVSWFAMFIGLVGGIGLPLGVPPLAEDPKLANVAPEQCLFYANLAGVAEPDAKSENQAEQLLAEPEVAQMGMELERAVRAQFKLVTARGGLPPGVTSDDAVDVLKTLLTRPMAVYLASAGDRPEGLDLHAGLMVNLGPNGAKIRQKLAVLVGTLPPGAIEPLVVNGHRFQSLMGVPSLALAWGDLDDYLLLAIGKGELEAMVKRIDGRPPQWLAQMREQLRVQRPATISYINLRAIRETMAPALGPSATPVMQALGLGNATSLNSITGLDQTGCVTKTLLAIEGAPRGLLRLADAPPLLAADMAPIPADATVAVAIKLDPAKALNILLESAEAVDPRLKQELLRVVGRTEDALGVRVADDLLAPLGDSCRLFDSPGEGGTFSGLTLVVSLKDARRAAGVQDRLVSALLRRSSIGGGPGGNRPRLEKIDFAHQRIFTIPNDQPDGPPFTPSWCLTDKELIVSLLPQSIKAYLSRPANFASLVTLPEVAPIFQGDTGPSEFVYGDTRRLFDLFYPLAATVSKREFDSSYLRGIDLSRVLLPSARAIRPHLTPTVVAARRSDAGLIMVGRSTLAGSSAGVAMPLGAMALLPGVQSARSRARQLTSMNQLKQIAVAMYGYREANQTFPPAYSSDKNGKPLLSWRVLVLPYLDQGELYRQFHLDEPWDGEHNKKLIAKMPAVFMSPATRLTEAGKTNYLTVRGDGTVFPGKKGIAISDIPDGTSNTILAVEAADGSAVVWTKPDDFEYDAQDSAKGLVGLWPDVFLAVMADGSVRALSSSIDAKSLDYLFRRNDGHAVDIGLLGQ